MNPVTRKALRDAYGRLADWRKPEPKSGPTAVPTASLPPGPAVRRTIRQAYAGRFTSKTDAPSPPPTAITVRHLI